MKYGPATPLHQWEACPVGGIEFSKRIFRRNHNWIFEVSTCLDLPPPIPCCHLTIHSVLQLLVFIMLFRCVFHLILECRISNQLTHTLNWVPLPELDFFNDSIAVLILVISNNFENFTCPLWALQKTVNLLKKCMLVLGRWAGTGLNLDGDSTLHNHCGEHLYVLSQVSKTC